VAAPVLMAFLFGILSACSFPLGALSSGAWKPRDRSLAFLLAFGGGALLAALTIDLVSPAVEEGHFPFLAAGCIWGSLVFVGLNHLVNERGGFLRKTSTLLHYIRRQERKRFKHLLSQMQRITVFHDLPQEEAEKLAEAAFKRDYKKGDLVYRQGDPSNHLYVIETGEVELRAPQDDGQELQRLKANDAFGRIGFFTGTPRASVAVATADTHLWVLARPAFEHIVETSPKLAEALQEFLQGNEVATELQEQQGLTPTQVKEWVVMAIHSVQEGRAIPSAVNLEEKKQEFAHALQHIHRVPLFQQLPPHDVEAIAACVFTKRHDKGHTFFHQQEPADRMYIIEQGEVALLDPQNHTRSQVTLHENDAFGGMSFFTGSRHAVTAVATTDTTVWVLRKRDFESLLKESPTLVRAVRSFFQQGEIVNYLQQKQGFDPTKAAHWVRTAVHSMDLDKFIPSAADMTETIKARQGAPFAILLGNVLDGIPGALVVGTSMYHTHVSISLIAGLFLSNYPAALSSSIGMQQQGLSFTRALWMWNAVTLLTGVGAAVGYVFFADASPSLCAFVEGIAVGASLTMLAETMLPEAYFKDSSVVGFSTLLGFLAAVFFKTLQ